VVKEDIKKERLEYIMPKMMQKSGQTQFIGKKTLLLRQNGENVKITGC